MKIRLPGGISVMSIISTTLARFHPKPTSLCTWTPARRVPVRLEGGDLVVVVGAQRLGTERRRDLIGRETVPHEEPHRILLQRQDRGTGHHQHPVVPGRVGIPLRHAHAGVGGTSHRRIILAQVEEGDLPVVAHEVVAHDRQHADDAGGAIAEVGRLGDADVDPDQLLDEALPLCPRQLLQPLRRRDGGAQAVLQRHELTLHRPSRPRAA